jgi:hypothetical protein
MHATDDKAPTSAWIFILAAWSFILAANVLISAISPPEAL